MPAPAESRCQVKIEHVVRHAIGPRADHQADDLRMGERFFINGPQSLDRRVGVRGRLEVREEVAALAVAEPHPRDALVDLPADAGPGQPAAGAEAAVVAECAAAGGDRAIDVGAGKTGVDADLLHPPAKPLAEEEIARVIGKPASRQPFRAAWAAARDSRLDSP